MATSTIVGAEERGDSLAALRDDRFHVLDGMRGLAAFLVMLFHYFNETFAHHAPNVYIAVDFFFVLSGFVVAHAYGARLGREMSAGDYVARRVARLAPSMAIGLIVGTIVLALAHRQGLASYSPMQLVTALIANLAFIPYLNDGFIILGGRPNVGILFPADLALWSIFFEMVASIAFIWLARASFRLLLLVCGFALLVGVAYSIYRGIAENGPLLTPNGGFATSNVLSGFPRVFFAFTCGMVLNRLYQSRSDRGTTFAGVPRVSPYALYLVLVVMLLCPFEAQGFYFYFAAALLSPLIVALGSVVRLRPGRLLVVSEWLGVISYPLYCVHEPIHRVMGGAVKLLHLPQGAKTAADVAAVPIAVVAAWFIAVYVERQMQKPLLAGLRRVLAPNRR